ncbi:MAG: phosphoribosyltransferase [Chlamydiae bacterium]|nr:phosphoribosyltransferase [Chlamydiota bacterium]
MIFKNRTDAGQKLASVLKMKNYNNPFIIALPRGGVIIAKEIALVLKSPLSLIITQKIGHPASPEYAIGAISADGSIILNNYEIDNLEKGYIEKIKKEKLVEAQRRQQPYLKGRSTPDLRGHTVILVDDGLATGLTMKLAIQILKSKNPKKIIIAVPISSLEASKEVKTLIDEFVCLNVEQDLQSLGEFYEDFSQVTDKEVINTLEEVESTAKDA